MRRPGYLSNWSGLGQTTTTGRAGPNQAGGLTTSYSNNLVFNPDQFDIVYNVAFGIGRPQGLPSQYVPPSQLGLPTAVATWIWNPKSGPTPWPGTGAPPSNASVTSKNINSLAMPATSQPSTTTTTTSNIVASKSNSTMIYLMIAGLLILGTFLVLERRKKKKLQTSSSPLPNVSKK